MPQMCGTRPPIPASHLHELTGNTLAKLNNYFYFSKQRGEKVRKRKNFAFQPHLLTYVLSRRMNTGMRIVTYVWLHLT